MIYQDILSAEPQDLHPELNEEFYSIPLDLNQLIKILLLLYENDEQEIHSYILKFLEEEYSQNLSPVIPL